MFKPHPFSVISPSCKSIQCQHNSQDRQSTAQNKLAQTHLEFSVQLLQPGLQFGVEFSHCSCSGRTTGAVAAIAKMEDSDSNSDSESSDNATALRSRGGFWRIPT